MEFLIQVYIVFIGLIIGSYLNVLIYRIPLSISTIKGSSYCPVCEHKLSWLDLFPLFSYIFLLGKCRYCKTKISPRYPIIEIINTLCYLLIYLKFGFSLVSLIYAVVSSCLIVLAMIDIDHKIMPDRFWIIIGVCGLILGFVSDDITWTDRLIGLFAVSLPLYIIVLATAGMGEGDVKLFVACGLLLGWQSILLALLISSVITAIYGIILMKIKKANRKSELPFGPFIALSVLICIFIGKDIINIYLSFLI